MAREEKAAVKAAGDDFKMSWVFNAPRERLFRAWTEPEELKAWWGPRHFTTPVVRIEARPGGSYFTCMRSPDGKDYCSTGTLREVRPPERLVYTDSFADVNGKPVPASVYGMDPAWPAEMLVEVDFEEWAGMTKVTLRSGVPRSLAERDMAPQGWAESFVKLAEHLEKG